MQEVAEASPANEDSSKNLRQSAGPATGAAKTGGFAGAEEERKKQEDQEAYDATYRQLQLKNKRLAEEAALPTRSIPELEAHAENLCRDDKGLTLGPFEEATLAFLAPEERIEVRPSAAQIEKLVRQPHSSKPVSQYNYLFEKWDADVTHRVVDDTDADQTKVMYHIQMAEKKLHVQQRKIEDTFTKFESMKQLLEQSKLIHETITEDGVAPGEGRSDFFPEREDLKFQDVEWKQIEQTQLGRRLNTYFNQLRTDKKNLQHQVKGIMRNQEFEMNELAARLKVDMKKAYERQLRSNYRAFDDEVKDLRRQYTALQHSVGAIEKACDKLKYKYYEQEYIWVEVKKLLHTRDIRGVYRNLGVAMPPDLKHALEAGGALFWEQFVRAPTNRYDTRGICSQELGYVETSLGVQPPAGGRKLAKESLFDGLVDIEDVGDMFEPLKTTPAEMKRAYADM